MPQTGTMILRPPGRGKLSLSQELEIFRVSDGSTACARRVATHSPAARTGRLLERRREIDFVPDGVRRGIRKVNRDGLHVVGWQKHIGVHR